LPLPCADLEDLVRAQAAHDSAVARGDLGQVFHANVEFHELLFAKSGNPYLAEAIRQFALRTHGIRFYCLTYPGYLEQARIEHWQMITAIKHCDRDALVCLCRQHLLASRLCYEKAAGIRGASDAAAESPQVALARDDVTRTAIEGDAVSPNGK
jgi:DNA-binding GntR family transcriptional regulator